MNDTPLERDSDKVMDMSGDQVGFVEGLWYAIEQLVICYDETSLAKYIIEESGIGEEEFRSTLEKTQYEVELLSKFLDEVFK